VHYTTNYGILELRQAIADRLQQHNGLEYDPVSEIIVTSGSNEAVFLAMMALLDPGDEVLIPTPAWQHYTYCALLAGAVPVPVPLTMKHGFQPQLGEFRRRVSARTRMMVINTPHNPTGVVFAREHLQHLADFAETHDLLVLSDEIYERMVYEGARHISPASFAGMQGRTLTINGFSKVFSMTGWRLGYIAAPAEMVSALIRVHQYTQVCAVSFCQWAGLAALNGPQDPIAMMIGEFGRRRAMVTQRLLQMPGVRLVRPQGAFYVFPDLSAYGLDGMKLADYLLEKASVAVVPGEAFGDNLEGHIRLSCANAFEKLEEGLTAMHRALESLPA
jgi:aspartate/methionine/tyrosine aminotransferase